MRRQLNRILFFLSILSSLGGIAAISEPLTRQLAQSDPERLVSAFKIEGKAKFSREKARKLASIQEGMKLADIDPEAVIERFRELGLFSEVRLEVELPGDSAIVTLTLQEKITLVPFPMVMVSDGRQSYGAMVMDYDFLGSGRSLLLGGSYSSDNTWMAMLGTGTRPQPGAIGYQVQLAGGAGELETQWADGETYRSWKAASLSSMASASAPIGQLLSLRVSGRASYSKGLEYDEARYAPEDSFWLSPGIGLSLDDQRHGDFFASGFRADLALSPGFDLWQGDSYLSLTASAGFGLPLFGEGALLLSAGGELSNRPDSALAKVSGSRILMGTMVQASSHAQGAAAFEYPVLEGRALIMTLGAFYEGGALREGIEGMRQTDFFHGPGAGLRVYLQKVALPALGIDIDYEVVTGTANFGFAFGFSR